MKDFMKMYRQNGNIVYEHIGQQESTSLKCGYCGMMVAPNRGYRIYAKYHAGGEKLVGYVYVCPNCKNPIFYFCGSGETVPGAMYGREIKNLPESIQTLYNECRTCYANQCYTSAQMIARTILMHIAVEQGAEESKPFAYYVNYLDENHYVPPNGRQWVDFIRTSGNVANHQIVI